MLECVKRSSEFRVHAYLEVCAFRAHVSPNSGSPRLAIDDSEGNQNEVSRASQRKDREVHSSLLGWGEGGAPKSEICLLHLRRFVLQGLIFLSSDTIELRETGSFPFFPYVVPYAAL